MISKGHRLQDILDYTYQQFRLFVDVCIREKKEKERASFELMLTAARGDKDAVDSLRNNYES